MCNHTWSQAWMVHVIPLLLWSLLNDILQKYWRYLGWKGWISQKVDREWLLGVSCKRLGKQNWKGKTKWRWGLIIYFLRIINMPHHLTQRLCPSEMASWPTARTLCFIRRWIRFQLGSFRPATNSYIFLFYPKYLYVIFKWQILWSLHKEGLLCHWYSEGVKWGC